MPIHRRTTAAALAAGVLLPAHAWAQAAAATPEAPGIAFAQVAAAVKPGSWKWTMKRTADGQSQDFGTRVLTLQRSKGAPGWLLLDAQSNAMVTMSDSLILGVSDFGTERRAMSVETPMGAVTMAIRFTADSVTGAMQGQGQAQTIAMKNVRGAISSDGVLLLALGTLPLAEGWTGHVDVLNPAAGGTIPITLAVKGSERVSVPAGSFDTWVVESTSGAGSMKLYVAKGGPVVRVVANVPQLGGTLESVLER